MLLTVQFVIVICYLAERLMQEVKEVNSFVHLARSLFVIFTMNPLTSLAIICNSLVCEG